MSSPEFAIAPFGGDKAAMAHVAALHLELRYWQRANGQSQFPGPGRILDSQEDLQSIDTNYIRAGGNFWIATWLANAAIVGFVGVKKINEQTAELMRLSTMPEYQGRGIGTALVGTAKDWAVQAGFQKLILSTGYHESGGPIYEKAGFIKLGDNPVYEDTYDMEVVLTKESGHLI